MTTAASFELSWPTALSKFFSLFNFVGDTFEGFVNLDCFLYSVGLYDDDETNSTSNSHYKSKVIFITLIPVLVIVVYLNVFMIVNAIFFKKNKEYIRNHIIMSFCVILFSLHPTLTKFLFGVYNCIELDSGE